VGCVVGGSHTAADRWTWGPAASEPAVDIETGPVPLQAVHAAAGAAAAPDADAAGALGANGDGVSREVCPGAKAMVGRRPRPASPGGAAAAWALHGGRLGARRHVRADRGVRLQVGGVGVEAGVDGRPAGVLLPVHESRVLRLRRRAHLLDQETAAELLQIERRRLRG